MKCKQRLCFRNKNVSQNGNCSVCDGVIENVTSSHKKVDEKKTVKKVVVNMNQMVNMHRKLSNGVNIDPKDVSVLVLGGIINIISQHDELEDLEERIKAIEHNDITNQTRLTSLENWVIKQGEVIEEVKERLSPMDVNDAIVKESKEIEAMQKKIVSLEIKASTATKPTESKELKNNKQRVNPV